MKTLVTLAAILLSLLWNNIFAQNAVDTQISEAEAAYEREDYEAARLAAQEAINGLNTLIANEILQLLPENIGELDADTDQDSYTGQVMGVNNLFVNRQYQSSDGEKKLEVELINNSPMLSIVNSFITSPLSGLMRDENQSVVRVAGYKAMLEHDTEGEVPEMTLSLPFGGSSLLIFRYVNYDSEEEVLGLTEQIPIKEIVEVAE